MEPTMHWLIYAALALYCASAAASLAKRTKPAMALTAAGFLMHTAYQAWRGWMTGVFIANNIFDPVLFLPWCMALLVVVNLFDPARREDWLTFTVPLALFSIFALFYPKGVIPPTPKKITFWAALFFSTEVAAHAFFYAGAWFALRHRDRPAKESPYHALLVWGFLIYSVTQVTGAVWAWIGWGTTFRWGSRHLFSAAMWCYFALYIHLRYMQDWSESGRARYAAFGGIVTLALSFAGYIHEMFFPRLGG